MRILPESPAGYAAIASLHMRAFGQRAAEAVVVALRRQSPGFDPELSLAAEIDGAIVGHALFTPERIRLLDGDVRALNLAPIAVDPRWQRRGIGAALMEEGHAAARRKNFPLVFLLGYPEYYRRFGYQPRCFGAATAVVRAPDPAPPTSLEQRLPSEADVAALEDLWCREQAAVDFAIRPEAGLAGWVSPHPAIRSTVYLRDGEVAGYTRVHAGEPLAPRAFLAVDDLAAQAIADELLRAAATPAPELVLPLHPASASGRLFGAFAEAWDAGMARAIEPGVLEEYLARVAGGQRHPGAPVWPVVFDLA